ncbi:hypothetical protein [Streptomyces sp. NPDC007088]|uniref:hypothetical protein n=1 Tax=Streptomyces sp. NPDC007088 TaxID=3364773 RepID=UPI0036A27B38
MSAEMERIHEEALIENEERDWWRTGKIPCSDCGTVVRTKTLETLPSHGCAQRQRARRERLAADMPTTNETRSEDTMSDIKTEIREETLRLAAAWLRKKYGLTNRAAGDLLRLAELESQGRGALEAQPGPKAILSAAPQQKTAEPAGLVIKVRHWPDRVKNRRSTAVHGAELGSGLAVKTACKKSYSESGVNFLGEDEPITCAKCQKAIDGGW